MDRRWYWALAIAVVAIIAVAWMQQDSVPADEFQFVLWEDPGAYVSAQTMFQPVISEEVTRGGDVMVWPELSALAPGAALDSLRIQTEAGVFIASSKMSGSAWNDSCQCREPTGWHVEASVMLWRATAGDDPSYDMLKEVLLTIDPSVNLNAWEFIRGASGEHGEPVTRAVGPQLRVAAWLADQGGLEAAQLDVPMDGELVDLVKTGAYADWGNVSARIRMTLWAGEIDGAQVYVDGLGRVQVLREGSPWASAQEAIADAYTVTQTLHTSPPTNAFVARGTYDNVGSPQLKRIA